MDDFSTSVSGLGKTMFGLKDSAIFLGSLYFICFVLILPLYLQKSGGLVIGLSTVLIGILSIVLVHLFLNWLYVAVVALPLMMAIITFSLGFLIWIISPIIAFGAHSIMELMMSIITVLVGSSFIKLDFSLLNEILTRIGMALMTIGGGLWWLVQKAKDIKYKALGVYITLFALYGVVSGITSLSSLVVFLFIWLAIYMKVHGDDNIMDLRLLFKIVASTVTVLGTYGVGVIKSGAMWYGTSLINKTLYYFDAPTVDNAGWAAFGILYNLLIGTFILFGIWKPQYVLERIPQPVKGFLTETLKKGMMMIRIS